ncbi:MRN complex-interacting protein [Cyclopterus lumpus]|uniref:MRN complex-interacting protein n=1 Tax=Cyclopterus lumpus TaxID=8103 RepID=UPI001486720F|nr:MRN complex-interacting protein [Cyclopterus lumpus]
MCLPVSSRSERFKQTRDPEAAAPEQDPDPDRLGSAMGQDFHVVRCSICQSFQVQQVKKVNKWSCKLCGEKQSLLKEFGRGSGADCRRQVQKLNALRGAVMEKQEHNTWSLWKQVEADRQNVPEQQDQVKQTGSSRWSKYLNTPEEAEPEKAEVEENVLMDRQQLHGNNMIDRKRKKIKGATDSWTPEQTNWSSLKMKPVETSLANTSPPSENHTSPPSENHTSPPSENHTSPPSENHTSPPSENHTSPPSENHTSPPSENHTSPPRKKSINPPSVSPGPVSKWSCFLRTDCQEQGEEPSVSGRSQSVGGAASCNDIISRATLLPASSMFDSGEDFSLNF